MPQRAPRTKAALHYFDDGIRHVVVGARGSWSLTGEAGQIPVLTFTMTGLYAAPTDNAIGSVIKQNQAFPVLFKNGNTTSFSVFGFAAALQSYSFDCNNETIYHELVGGTKEVLITDRKPGGTMSVEAVALSAITSLPMPLAAAQAPTLSSTVRALQHLHL